MKTATFVVTLLLAVLCIGFVVQAQNKTFVSIPNNPWTDPTLSQLGNTFLTAWENQMIDTTVGIYIYKKIYWDCQQTLFYQVDSTAYDSSSAGKVQHLLNIVCADSILHYCFSVDSIRDRGANRQVLFNASFKTRDTTKWCIFKDRFVAIGDTVESHHINDSIGTTKDSTYHQLVWLKYTNNSNPVANSVGVGAGNYYLMSVYYMGKPGHVTIWLDHITGDPTKYGGLNQMCQIHFQMRQEPNQAWWNAYFGSPLK